MKALDRKTLRDLWGMRGQALAICLVMACGIATFVMSLAMLDSLQRSLDSYYQRYRFPDVFASMTRAPDAVAARLAGIPGVARAETRIAEAITLDMPGLAEPAVGRLISLPEGREARLGRLHLRSGRRPERGRRREVLVGEAFAQAHGLEPGDTVTAVLNGRLDELLVTGIGLSPEYIYEIRPGDILPDNRRYGVFWMPESVLAAAFDMDGAFNDLVLALMPGASEGEVIARVDDLLAPYGGLGAHGRADQTSHEFVTNEIRELRGMALIAPAIFLVVAAFLLNVVIARVVATQREQIAALKALGYGGREIGLHYAQLVGLITAGAVFLGTAGGAWMAMGLTGMYTRFFRFPVLEFHLQPRIVFLAIAVAGVSAALATFGAVRAAMRLPPAEAMRPAPPPAFRPTVIERTGLQRMLSPATRMILRQLERRPMKALMSCTGVALGTAVLVLGFFMEDAIDYTLRLQFEVIQRYDLLVVFTDDRSIDAIRELEHLPGARRAEPFRGVPIRLRHEHRERRLGLTGLDGEGGLLRLVNLDGSSVRLPPNGLVLSEKLASLLGAGVGDVLTVEVLDGERPTRRVPVAGLVSDFAGLSAYMRRDAIGRMLREGSRASGAFVTADPEAIDTLFRKLKAVPQVAGVTVKTAAIESFRETVAESLMRMRTFNIVFAVIIAFGVVYNGARISLAERSRELATLRVIGFTRTEISLIQLGELALLTLAGIPLGLLIGYGFAAMVCHAQDTELFRIPLIVDRSTYAVSATVVMLAALASGLVVRRMLDRLDLVAVLKSRE